MNKSKDEIQEEMKFLKKQLKKLRQNKALINSSSEVKQKYDHFRKQVKELEREYKRQSIEERKRNMKQG